MLNYSSLSTPPVALRPARRPVLRIVTEANHDELRSAPVSAASFRNIAVALDGSPLGELAIPYALRIAKLSKASLHIMYVRKSPLSRTGRRYLRDVAERLEGADVHLADPICFEGSGAVERLCGAVSDSMDLVVTACRRSAVGRMLFGSVSDRLLQTASAPLLIVRGSIPPSDLHWSPPLRRVLVPLVGHEAQHKVLETVAEIGRIASGSQTLLRILPIETDSVASDGQEAPRHPATALSMLRDAERDLREAAGYLPNPRTRLVYSSMRLENAVSPTAIANGFDLVALSTRARNGLRRLVRPDVYDDLLRRTSLPLLVLREESKIA